MPALTILSIDPQNNAADVVLGTSILVTFSAPVDAQSIGSGTFICFGPGETGILGPDELIRQSPSIVTGREYITGAFTFPAPNQFLFNPDRPLRPNQQYTVLLSGAGGVIVQDVVKALDGTPLSSSVQTTFVTGSIDQSVVPPDSPLPWDDPATQPWERPVIDPNSIVVAPVLSEGNDLSQQIVLTFPAAIDPASFNLADVLVSVEALSNDPLITVPTGLNYSVVVQGNRLVVSIGSWPTPPAPPAPLPDAPFEDSVDADMGLLNPWTPLGY
jgi:Bacterial Ig-like domain